MRLHADTAHHLIERPALYEDSTTEVPQAVALVPPNHRELLAKLKHDGERRWYVAKQLSVVWAPHA
jgi:hypothetical protein